jgi:NAD(P)H-hydrate epimerase
MLGGGYGRRVVVVAGKGNNGNDGREAATHLRRRGVRVDVIDAAGAPARLPRCDVVVDAAYGTGFRGDYAAPDPGPAPVLAVDIPSGVDGLTGAAGDGTVHATRTVTFAALKPGLVLPPGRELAGAVDVVDIGLDVSSASAAVVERSDVAAWLPRRRVDTHKWKAAVWIVAGSPGMTGAAHLAVAGAQRAGAGYVRLGSPGVADDPFKPLEAVGHALPERGWEDDVLADLDRFSALVVGPGLGRGDATAAAVRRLVARAPVPVVVDGDGLSALGEGEDVAGVVAERRHATVLTPHEGEYAALAGERVPGDRLAAARTLAQTTGATVLLKGPTTVVAGDGRVLLSTSGDERLATAGTGDVLSGVIGALLAQGVAPAEAAVAGAFLHGRAGALGWRRGLVAGDLVRQLPAVFEELES